MHSIDIGTLFSFLRHCLSSRCIVFMLIILTLLLLAVVLLLLGSLWRNETIIMASDMPDEVRKKASFVALFLPCVFLDERSPDPKALVCGTKPERDSWIRTYLSG